MSDLTPTPRPINKSNFNHAKYQSAIQTYTAYGISQVNSNIKKLQESSIEQNKVLNQQLIIQENIEKIQNQQLQINQASLDEQKKSNQLQRLKIELDKQRDQRNEVRINKELAEKKHISLQKNLAFEAFSALKKISSNEYTNLEKVYFFRATMQLLDTIDYEEFEIEDKIFVSNTKDDAMKLGKTLEDCLTKNDLDSIKKIEKILLEDEDKLLFEIEENINKTLVFFEYFYFLSEIKDTLEYSIPRLKSKRKTVENQINEKSILSSNKILEDTINTEIAKLDLENTSIKLIFEYLKECKKSIKEIIK